METPLFDDDKRLLINIILKLDMRSFNIFNCIKHYFIESLSYFNSGPNVKPSLVR